MDQPGFQWSAEAPVGLADTERAVALLATRLPPSLRVLAELAYDLGAAWQPGGMALFGAVDPWRWEALRHNPVRLLLETSPTRLARLAEDR
jgi:starch phosphorylase